VLTLGILCGLTCEPRATAVAARQAGLDPAELSLVSYRGAGLDPAELSLVSYRGPGWPGGMRLETHRGLVRLRDYPDYWNRHLAALTRPRCRICPDALAELSDISVGDT